MQEIYPLLAEAEVLVLAAPIYYFTLSAQIQAPIQRIYNMNKPGKLKKTASRLATNPAVEMRQPDMLQYTCND